MKTGEITRTVRGAALTLLALALSTTPGAAQSSDDCRCVDRDGNAIERCSCFRAPALDGLAQSWSFTSDERPRLGISVDAGQSARRDAMGALVTDVLEGGPADDAGIELGDVITAIGGSSLFEPVDGIDEDAFDLDRSIPVQRLLAIARGLEAGEEVEVAYVRDGEQRSVTLEAEDLSSTWGNRFSYRSPRWDSGRLREELRELTDGARTLRFRRDGMDQDWSPLLQPGGVGGVHVFGGGANGPGVLLGALGQGVEGLELVALNPELGSYFGATEGVLVANVSEESTLGLEPGDVVLRIGERAVTTPDRLRRILLSYAADEDITFHVRRDGSERAVTGRRR